MNEHDCVQIKLCLWTLKFEFHVKFLIQKYYSSFDPLQQFYNVRAILSCVCTNSCGGSRLDYNLWLKIILQLFFFFCSFIEWKSLKSPDWLSYLVSRSGQYVSKLLNIWILWSIGVFFLIHNMLRGIHDINLCSVSPSSHPPFTSVFWFFKWIYTCPYRKHLSMQDL